MKKTGVFSVIFAFIFAIFFGFSGNAIADNCSSGSKMKEASYNKSSMDIVETAMSADGFNTLVTAVKAAGLVDALKSDGPFTVFAPTDDAFASLPEGTLEALLNDKEKLVMILKYHVVAGKVKAKDVMNISTASSLSGQNIAIKATDKGVMVDKANVIKTDIMASNGVIHVIDKVILPKDIIETAMTTDGFGTLVTAIKTAGLVDALRGEGPFTVFAPTDDAFAKLPKGTIPALLKDQEKLTSILTYHVVPGKVMASDVVKVNSAETLNGQNVAVKVNGKKVMIDNAQVIMTDIVCTNGVIHVIDEVILPQEQMKRSEY